MPLSAHFALARSPIPCLLSGFARRHVKAHCQRLGLCSPGVLPGGCAWRHPALPSSRVIPLYACPALRPRWCPAGSPFPGQDCCLPLHRMRRLSLQCSGGYPTDHDYTYFGAQYHGLHTRYPRLHTPPHEDARGFASDPPARLWSGGT
jgi:hypothetical protein